MPAARLLAPRPRRDRSTRITLPAPARAEERGTPSSDGPAPDDHHVRMLAGSVRLGTDLQAPATGGQAPATAGLLCARSDPA